MKKLLKLIYAIPVFLPLVAFSSCIELFDYDYGDNYVEDAFYLEDDDTDFIKHLGDRDSITLSGVKGKAILYVNYNRNSKGTVKRERVRFLASSRGLNQQYNGLTTAQREVSSSAAAEPVVLPDSRIKQAPFFKSPGKVDRSHRDFSSRAVSGSEPKGTEHYVGENRSFFIDTDVGISVFKQKNTVLRAKNDVCLVWVESNCYTSDTSRGKYVNTSVAEDIAARFKEYYEHERHIFGKEGEYLVQEESSGDGYVMDDPMPETLVNIVIYDIGNDYGKYDQCGVTGYFYSKDYWNPSKNSRSASKYSNKGKFFYLDSAYCNYISENDEDGEEDDSIVFAGLRGANGKSVASDTIITTLYHEFQHMIGYARNDYEDEPAWYTEMLSMLAEDMFSESLNTGFKDSPYGARLPLFNQLYFVSGIDEWQEQPFNIVSYSTAYAFGAWLCRNYGGPEFVKDLCSSGKNGMEAVRSVVKARTGEDVSSNQIYRRFISSCVFRNKFTGRYGLCTFNKDAGGSITYGGKTSVMKAIDLFSEDLLDFNDDTTEDKQLGPRIFANGYLSDALQGKNSDGKVVTYNSELRPHGFVIHFAGIADSDTVTLNFSERRTQSEDIMIYIQDSFKN